MDAPPRTKLTRQGPRRISPGDEFVFSAPLLDGGTRVGELYAQCTALNGARRFANVRFICEGSAAIRDGELAITTRFKEGSNITGQVVGGSGAYEGANGSFTSVGEENATDTFHIVTFTS